MRSSMSRVNFALVVAIRGKGLEMSKGTLVILALVLLLALSAFGAGWTWA